MADRENTYCVQINVKFKPGQVAKLNEKIGTREKTAFIRNATMEALEGEDFILDRFLARVKRAYREEIVNNGGKK